MHALTSSSAGAVGQTCSIKIRCVVSLALVPVKLTATMATRGSRAAWLKSPCTGLPISKTGNSGASHAYSSKRETVAQLYCFEHEDFKITNNLRDKPVILVLRKHGTNVGPLPQWHAIGAGLQFLHPANLLGQCRSAGHSSQSETSKTVLYSR
jgi:hypothetical protein